MATQYSITAVNNSSNTTSIAVFQSAPNTNVEDVFTLAWFAKSSVPLTTLVFEWEIQYDFVWSETGTLVPGVLFLASQTFPADLSTTNQITLDYENGDYEFTNQIAGGAAGSLFITETANVPMGMASVGVGMSGAGTFVVQAQPNLTLMFTPTPTYWIIAGNFEQGQVMSVEQITAAYMVTFPPGVQAMSAVLNPDNTFTIASMSAVNDAIRTVRTHRPSLLK